MSSSARDGASAVLAVVGYFLVFFAAMTLGGILFLLGGIALILIPGSLPLWAEIAYVLVGLAGTITIGILAANGAYRRGSRRAASVASAPSTPASVGASASVPPASVGASVSVGASASVPPASVGASVSSAGTSSPARPTSRPRAKVLAWLAGIAGTVIGGVLSAALATLVTNYLETH